jgi:hypothetical protein
MAMVTERDLSKIEVTIDPEGNHSIYVIYQYTFDDPEDNMLPLTSYKGFTIRAGDDVSGHDSFVQDLVSTVYANYVKPSIGE